MPYVIVLALALALFTTGCPEPSRFGDTARTDASNGDESLDASNTDDIAHDIPRGPCIPGEWRCESSDRATLCSVDGGTAMIQMCSGDSVCIGGPIGCGSCRPGEVQCSPTSAESPQQCAADGHWEQHAACDSDSGEHCLAGICQRPCAGAGDGTNSYLGCEYWATPTANSGVDYRFAYAIVLANPGTREAHVRLEGGPLASFVMRTVAPGSVERINLPWIDVLKGSTAACHPFPTDPRNCSPRSVQTHQADHAGAYHVVSDVPLAAYQFNPMEYRSGTTSGDVFSFTADASLLLPQSVLGDPRTQEYIVATRPNWTPMNSTGVYGGFVTIVGGGPAGASLDVLIDTTAAVSDPAMPSRELPRGRHVFRLARGDVLQLIGTRDGEDLTGTAIRANGPIAVFAGHDCTNVPSERAACDHLEEQFLPSATWGRRYAVTYLRDRVAEPNEESVIRIVSQVDGNRLTFDGMTTPPSCARTLARGEFCDFTTAGNFIVSGERPILAVQFMHGLGMRAECGVTFGTPPQDRPDCVGDPAMVIEVPIEQFRNRYDVLIPATYVLNFVNLVAPPGAEITLDGMPLDASRVRAAEPVGAGLEVRVLRIDPGAHTLATRDGRVFGVKVYGVASYTSYMYPGGLDLRPINPPG